MLRRLPISLRFDDEDSDFYYGFIEQKKNDRELSSLILDLLHVYYENEDVRNIVDDYVISKSPYMHIHEQLERIALEHSKQSVSTNMLNDFTDNARRKVSEPSEPIKEEKKEVKEEPLLLAEAMDKLGPMIEQRITELFTQFVANSNTNITPEMVKSAAVGVEGSIKKEVEESGFSVPPRVEKPHIEKPTMEKPRIEKPRIEKPVVEKAPMESSVVVNNMDEILEEVEKKPAKPASFGKLLGSVR